MPLKTVYKELVLGSAQLLILSLCLSYSFHADYCTSSIKCLFLVSPLVEMKKKS